MASRQEAERAKTKHRNYRGLARIQFSALNFDGALERGHRKPSRKITCTLQSKFELAGCN